MKTQRIHVSAQYERKLDHIEDQLDQVLHLLDGSASSRSTSRTSSQKAGDTSSRGVTKTASPTAPLENTNRTLSIPPAAHGANHASTHQTPFEGESSLAAHSTFAKDMVEAAIFVGPLGDHLSEMKETLTSLRATVEAQSSRLAAQEMAYTYAKTDSSPASSSQRLDDQNMPSPKLVMTMLKKLKEDPQLQHIRFHTFLPAEKFSDYVVKVYSTDDFNQAEFIIVNAGLIDIFVTQLFFEESDKGRNDLKESIVLFRENLETALSRLQMHIPSSLDYVVALTFGVLHAVKSSKPAIAWTLHTSALNMCISLGLHRVETLKNDNLQLREQKLWIFWLLYGTDKTLSLRLGRSSMIQDDDITLPLPSTDFTTSGPYGHSLVRWIKMASIQGKIYKNLYSPAGLAEPQAVRVSWVRALAQELKAVQYENRSLNLAHVSHGDGPQSFNSLPLALMLQTNEVNYLSALTLTLRALPPVMPTTSFAPECIATARAALEQHQKYSETIETGQSRPGQARHWDIYIKWTILHTPFVPFIVMFCHVIETGDVADLQRMQSFVSSLEIGELSEASTNIHGQFETLLKVAQRYTEIRAAKSPNVDEWQKLDAHVHAFGLLPAIGDSGMMADPGLFEQIMDSQMQAWKFGEWFQSSQQL